MSHYAYELKEATTFVNEKDFDKILVKIKEEVSAVKWQGYGWRNEVLNASRLEDVVGEFNILLMHEGNGYFRPIINDVYVSNFFSYLIDIVAPYMTDGEIVVNDEYDDVTIAFKDHVAVITRGEIKKGITIELATEKPSENTWSYPVEEITYIFEQIEDGTRVNGETFYLYNGRLYESYETK